MFASLVVFLLVDSFARDWFRFASFNSADIAGSLFVVKLFCFWGCGPWLWCLWYCLQLVFCWFALLFCGLWLLVWVAALRFGFVVLVSSRTCCGCFAVGWVWVWFGLVIVASGC